MEHNNENLSVWRNASKVAACVDLVFQILGVIAIIVLLCVMMAEMPNEMDFWWVVLILIVTVLLILLQVYLVVLAVRMIQGCSKERAVEDALNKATRWRSGQYFCLVQAISSIIRGYLGAGIMTALIRLTMVIIGTQFINELKRGTENRENTCEGEGLEV